MENNLIDWVQTFTIIGSMLVAWYTFYNITDKRIDRVEESIARMEEDQEKTIKEWRSEHTQQIQEMDAKWERLFERLLIQDQQKKAN